MHLIERTGALLELDEIYRQWRIGALSNAEYSAAFAMIDAAHSHDLRCANGDHRLAVLNIDGRLLCSACAWREREMHDPPRLADERPGYLLALERQVLP